MYDVIIIGAGVIGSAVARELSRYQLHILVVEKEEDVCCGTSKANSGIVHSGIDCKPGTLKAHMNLLGNEKMEALSKELDFPFRRNGSLILCFSEEDRPRLIKLYRQGIENGVPDLRILEKEDLHKLEPGVSDQAIAAVHAPSGGIVCPFGMNIALAENATENGVEFRFDTEVLTISKIPAGYQLLTNTGELRGRCVVNAAGVHADKFHNMVSARRIHITPRLGEYCLLDKTVGGLVDKTIFQLPTSSGKGILVTPTVHGNILIGPTARDSADKETTDTTAEGLAQVLWSAKRSVPDLPVRQIITSSCGSRAHEAGGEFIIGEPEDAPFFVADYHDYYKTDRGYHKRSLNSNGGWNVIGCMSFMNQPILQYSNEIRSAVLIMHGEKAHSCYFSRDAYDAMVKDNPYTDNKELLIIPDAVHTDLYDGGGKDAIPFDKLEQFFSENMR